ncbi:1-phosphatidylinositol phosphodiesterase-like [Ammospiza nelsoni]|uniref:1-phosphatidylinositol phosphodiesterase-like n=1 Tax=Ammospiza caudacuta TaxID=2857398 RepID=UPI002739D437|nr:1-phosphatidylinositol phosphodiesterase-like [Ammospiza caudacuta]XP_059334734.1 1-phosphatidylinositol phosphodiesterase-like [Ammospiza nelsoni]
MNPRCTCHLRGRTRVMTVTGLMAGIPLHLPVCRRHPRPCPAHWALLHSHRQTQGSGGPARCRGARSPGGMETWSRHSAAFDCVPQPAACCPDWMAGLPDALPLSHLSIPGTHDSLSLFGGRRLRCQSWGLEAQLAAGIRFLDVRCKLSRGELRIYHLCTFQRASLRGVLRRTLRFLRAHPGEAVLMRIKEELPIFSRPGFAAQLHRCLLEEGQGCVWCREEVPTLGQVRGKIVVLEALAREVLGIPYEQLSISDAWNVLSLEHKWARVRRHLEKAADGDPSTMYLTFCSGNGLFTCPEEVARFVNPRCCQHLRRRAGQPVRWGVVIMDFPGAGLLRLIVESNGPRANGRGTAAPGTPTVRSRHRRGTRERGRGPHSPARCPRRCPSGRTLLPAPRLGPRASGPGRQKRDSRPCRAAGSLRVTMV